MVRLIIKKFLNQNKPILLLLVFSLLLRVNYQMVWLEDWDSVQFAMALHQFDIGQNLPHAPGYPLYILLGKFFHLLAGNDTSALVSLSLFSALASIIFFYLINKKVLPENPRVAFWGTVVFSIVPIHLVMSIAALTNLVGLAAFLIFFYLLISRGKEKPFLAGFLGGLILGVRATEALSVVLVLFTWLWLSKSKLQEHFKSFLSLGSGIASWLVPLFLISGPANFFSAYGWISSYVIHHDSLLGQQDRFSRLSFLLKSGFGWSFLFLALIGLVLLLTKKVKVKKDFKLLILVWFLSYLLPLSLIFNLEVPRYTLPLLPPLAIFFSLLLIWLEKKVGRTGALIVLALGSFLVFKQGLSQLIRLKNSLPPTIASVKYIQENYSPTTTFLLTSFTYRQFQYYAPEFSPSYGQLPTELDLSGKKFIITDSESLKDQLLAEGHQTVSQPIKFQGDPDIYSRIPSLTLYVLSVQ